MHVQHIRIKNFRQPTGVEQFIVTRKGDKRRRILGLSRFVVQKEE